MLFVVQHLCKKEVVSECLTGSLGNLPRSVHGHRSWTVVVTSRLIAKTGLYELVGCRGGSLATYLDHLHEQSDWGIRVFVRGPQRSCMRR